MRIFAAVVAQPGAPFDVRELELDEIRSDEVRVRMVASGVCHTDAIIRDQMYQTPLPIVLGHEGSGIVEAIGDAVVSVQPGDHVVLSANSCGMCARCLSGDLAYCEQLFARNFGASRPDGSTSLSADGVDVGSMFFGQSSFSSYANVAERSVVKVDADADLALLGPLGCGIQTGAGAVLNDLRPKVGSSIAVFGTGAVGAAAIMAAVVAGCTTIVAVDLNDDRLTLMRELGATHTINGGREDTLARITELTGGTGLNFTIDTTGVPSVLRTAADSLGLRGTVVLLGAAKPGTEVSFEMGLSLTKGWTFKTIIEGSSVPQVFIPALVRLWKQGRFPFDKLTKKYSFTDINEAFADSERGDTIKPILVFDH